jgi:hypothetical protein
LLSRKQDEQLLALTQRVLFPKILTILIPFLRSCDLTSSGSLLTILSIWLDIVLPGLTLIILISQLIDVIALVTSQSLLTTFTHTSRRVVGIIATHIYH